MAERRSGRRGGAAADEPPAAPPGPAPAAALEVLPTDDPATAAWKQEIAEITKGTHPTLVAELEKHEAALASVPTPGDSLELGLRFLRLTIVGEAPEMRPELATKDDMSGVARRCAAMGMAAVVRPTRNYPTLRDVTPSADRVVRGDNSITSRRR